MKLPAVVMCVVLLAAGCGEASAPGPGPVGNGTGPPATAIGVDYEASWSPAWTPPSETRAEFEATLRQADIWILLPTAAPTAAAAGTLSLDLRITSRVPIGRPGADIVVRRADLSVFASVSMISVGEEPICAPRLQDAVNAAWSVAAIRGAGGCSLDAETLSYIAWTEDGQDFIAEFGSEIGIEIMAAWLDTWETVE